MNESRPTDGSWRIWATVMLAAAILSGPIIPKLLDRANEQERRDGGPGSHFVPTSPASNEASPEQKPVTAEASAGGGGVSIPLQSTTAPPPISTPPPAPIPAPAPLPDLDALPVQMIRLLTRADLVGKSRWELDIMRNEIYARHGRRFDRDDLQRYFDAKSWYRGLYTPREFSDSQLNSLERANANFIKEYEDAPW